MATRFIGTFECDAHANLKMYLLKKKISNLWNHLLVYLHGVMTNLQFSIENKSAKKVQCISNCVVPCNRGHEAKLVGYCIADRLGAAYNGDVDTGLFFTGSNGYRIR